MMTYPDEITNDTYLKMEFIEFLEGISRVANTMKTWTLPDPPKSNFDFKNICKFYTLK